MSLHASRAAGADDASTVSLSWIGHVVAIGGGTVTDAAKITAARGCLPLTVVPTVLSTDAPFSSVAAVHRGDIVEYVDTGAAEQVVLCPVVLEQTPWHLHLHGLGDLLSIESATRDWLARLPDSGAAVREAARALVAVALDHAALWQKPSQAGEELLVDLLRTKVALGLAAGHPWAEEGTEHYLAYLLEPHLARPVWHGELLLACLPVCAVLQEWDSRTIVSFRRILTALPDHAHGGTGLLPTQALRTVLADLPGYCRRHHLDNTLLDVDQLPDVVLNRAAEAWERGW